MFYFSPATTDEPTEWLQLAATAHTYSLARVGPSRGWRLGCSGSETCSEIALPGLSPALCGAALKSAAIDPCLSTYTPKKCRWC